MNATYRKFLLETAVLQLTQLLKEIWFFFKENFFTLNNKHNRDVVWPSFNWETPRNFDDVERILEACRQCETFEEWAFRLDSIQLDTRCDGLLEGRPFGKNLDSIRDVYLLELAMRVEKMLMKYVW